MFQLVFSIELPEGYEAQIRSRSGLAHKNGIFVLNSPGTIDSDYRQEVKVILMNLGDEEFCIEPHARIAQILIKRVEKFELIDSSDINETDRGGFGSTGMLDVNDIDNKDDHESEDTEDSDVDNADNNESISEDTIDDSDISETDIDESELEQN